jgi:hypothetical protein
MPRKGERATPAQRSALAAGQAKRKKALDNADPDAPDIKDRWRKLLSGTITVEDLDDEEVARMKVRGKGGQFNGKGKRLPSHLISAFHQEQIKRAKSSLTKDLKKAAEVLGQILDDPEAKHADKIKAAAILLDRGLGKTPETVNIKTVDPWADTLAEGAEVRDLRDLGDLAAEVQRLADDEAGGVPHD